MRTNLRNILLLATGLRLILVCQGSAQTIRTLHNFASTPGYESGTNIDGANPFSGLILSGNTLYGTSQYGGSKGGGTVFAINTDGTSFRALHSFAGAHYSDGLTPMGGLLLSGDTLYGTTVNGGLVFPNVFGTVFSISTNSAAVGILYAFAFSSSGEVEPQGGLNLLGNALYGTTWKTIFGINTDGSGFTTLHTATGTDGYGVYSRMALAGSTLYGVASSGGSWTNGALFDINTDGTGYTLLHSFTPTAVGTSTNSDGGQPVAPLVLSGNTLFGEASYGGTFAAGTLFTLNTDGTGFKVLHSFTGGNGGAMPSGLILWENTLYGTTAFGGSTGNGTVFLVNTDGTGFQTLASFTEGSQPIGELVISGNTLYGTTQFGGSGNNGTVFSFSLLPQLKITSSGPDIVVTWATNNAVGYTLQSTTDLVSGAWAPVSPGPSVINGVNFVTNSTSDKQRFYRINQ